jgi:hypothetical protein
MSGVLGAGSDTGYLVHFRIILLGCGMLILAALCVHSVAERRTSFKGDGVLTDSGFLSYPRYRVAFDPVVLANETQSTLRFEGLPAIRMTFGFESTKGTPAAAATDLQNLKSRGVALKVRIETGTGTVLSQVNAPVQKWEIARCPKRELLWHPALRDLPFKAGIRYRIVTELHNAPASLSLILRPVVEGGGNELP